MTPKEKALDLIKKFEDENLHFEVDILNSAKYYASICVDEILTAPLVGKGWLDKYKLYWVDVKKEINKL